MKQEMTEFQRINPFVLLRNSGVAIYTVLPV
jgi:hypothetical protein